MDITMDGKYILEIDGMTHEGQGVGRIEGFTVFVDGALLGEQVEVKIVKVNKSYAVGKLEKVLKEAPARLAPFCPVFEQCGGCSLQHMDYKAQIDYKTGVVRENIRRLGGIEDVKIHDAIGMENPLHYRNKAQYPVALVKGKTAAGFYARRSHDVIECECCGIQDETSSKVREIVKKFIDEKKIPAYDEKTGKGLVRHIMTRIGFKSGEVMVVLVINGKKLPHADELVEWLAMGIPGLKSVCLNVNMKNTNIILGDRNIKLYGSNTISDYIGKYRFEISPLSFYQVNPVQTEVLYRKALEFAGLTGKETVFDLYCGIGTISLFMSEKAGKVVGVEVVEAAVEDARKNAKLNGVENAEFVCGEAEVVVPRLYAEGARADVVVVDPPRKGCDEALLRTLVDMQPERIVYVSCNPATLARDLKFLEGNGYKTVEVQPVDMFPWTAHVESIILMTKCGSKGK